MKDFTFGGQPKTFGDLLKEVLTEIDADGGIESCIQKEKCVLIDDLMRVKKLLGAFKPEHLLDIGERVSATFDEYYELNLDQLEVKLATLSAKLRRMMRDEVEKNNRADWNKPDSDLWR